MKMGPTQKQNKSVQHRVRNNSTQVLDFIPWLKTRLAGMRDDGATVRCCEKKGILYIELTWPGKTPNVFTADEFQDEYEEVYLASFGLNCQVPFEENAGI